MADDTTRVPPALRANVIALAGVAVMTLTIAALAFTLSFDAIRQLAVEIGVRSNLSWMAPVALDVAQAAATLGLAALGVADEYRAARMYCMVLATATVLLSVAGNGYHSYRLAAVNASRVAAGEDLGFAPQPAPIAACIAMIFPLLWLGLFHLFTIMLRALKDEHTQNMGRASDEGTPAKQPCDTEWAVAAPAADVVAHGPARVLQRDDATEEFSATQLGTFNAVGLPTQHVDVVVQTTRNGWEQTRHGVQGFLAECTLSERVKEVAAMLIGEPHLRQVDVAQRLDVDRSTVCRRWKQFVAAAEDEGFTVPPLPQPLDADAPTDTRLTSELQPV